MSAARHEPRFHPNRWMRRMLGPIFGAACLLATCTGVVVLALLLGSIVAAALQGPPDHPWYAIGANLAELARPDPQAGLGVAIARSGRSAGLPGRDRGQSVAAGSGRGDRDSGRHRGGRLPRGIRAAGPAAADHPDQHRQSGRRAVDRLRHPRAWRCSCGPSGSRRLALGPTLLAGVLTLSLLILPIIVITTQEALRAVPQSLRQAALALGATRWQVVRDHVLPVGAAGHLDRHDPRVCRGRSARRPRCSWSARPARSSQLPKGPLDRYSALPVEIYNYAKEPDRRFQTVAAGGILILVALLLAMNAIAIVIRSRFRRYH